MNLGFLGREKIQVPYEMYTLFVHALYYQRVFMLIFKVDDVINM